MTARLGEVLYWTAAGLSILMGLFGALLIVGEGGADRWIGIYAVVAGGICWLGGRACLYILAGR